MSKSRSSGLPCYWHLGGILLMHAYHTWVGAQIIAIDKCLLGGIGTRCITIWWLVRTIHAFAVPVEVDF